MDCLRLFRWFVGVGVAGIATGPLAQAQSLPQGRSLASPDDVRSRLQPIGMPSAVDAFSKSRNPVRQVARMQLTGDGAFVPAPTLQGGGIGMPVNPVPGAGLGPSLPVQPRPQNLPMNNAVGTNGLAQPNPAAVNNGLRFQQPGISLGPNSFGQPPRPGTDYAPIAPPQLGNDFASMGNCRNISGPSTYRAAGAFGCNAPAGYGAPIYGPTTYGAPTTYVAPPAQIAPPIGLPPGAIVSPASYTGSLPPVLPGNPGYRPLLSFGQEKNPVQVGQGLLGQPVAYVPGQFVRNALRYISF